MPNLDGMLEGARDALTAGRVFGEPIEREGVTVIPAAEIRGCGCRCGGGEDVEGGRGGFGVKARPAGALVVRGEEVVWKPALDLGRVLRALTLLSVVALLLSCRSKRRCRR